MLLVIAYNFFNKEININKKTIEEGGVIGGAIDANKALSKKQREGLKVITNYININSNEIDEVLGINKSAVCKKINAIKYKL